MIDEIYRAIEQIRSWQISLVLIEQNAYRALAVADRAYVLERGSVSYAGAPEALEDQQRSGTPISATGPQVIRPEWHQLGGAVNESTMGRDGPGLGGFLRRRRLWHELQLGWLRRVGSGGSASGPIVIGATIPLTGSLAAFGHRTRSATASPLPRSTPKAGGSSATSAARSSSSTSTVRASRISPPHRAAPSPSRTTRSGSSGRSLPRWSSRSHRSPISSTSRSSITRRSGLAGGVKTGWSYSWDVFFNETQQTTTQYLATNEVKTNKRVVLFTDTDPDGITMGELWAQNAPKFGYKVVAHESFPEGTTDFSNYIGTPRQQAEVLIAQMIPPDATALWKQMKSAGYDPKVAYCEKCSYQSAWGNRSARSPMAPWSPTSGRRRSSTELSADRRPRRTSAARTTPGPAASPRLHMRQGPARRDSRPVRPAGRNQQGARPDQREYPVGHVSSTPSTTARSRRSRRSGATDRP